jgi:Carboxypeptidase regulatory-like domain
MTRFLLLLCCGALAACHPAPVIGSLPHVSAGGTIAGMVTTTDSTVPVVNRKVTVVDVGTGATFETTVAANGGYTIKVPEGTYRIEIELHAGEALERRPDNTHINNGDLDPHRNFVIAVKPPGRFT